MKKRKTKKRYGNYKDLNIKTFLCLLADDGKIYGWDGKEEYLIIKVKK
jgi:hypothetical protein